MKNGVMLYRCPGPHKLNGIDCEYIIVLENQADQFLNIGWSLTTAEADEKFKQEAEDCAQLMNEAPVPEDDRYLHYYEPEESPKEKLKYEDFSDLEKDNIQRDRRAMSLLAEIHNTTYYTIRKIKGKI